MLHKIHSAFRMPLVTTSFWRVWCWCCDNYNWVCFSQSLLPSLSGAWTLWAGGTFCSPQPRLLWLQPRNSHCAGPSVAETWLPSPCGQPGSKDDQQCDSDLACCWLLPDSSHALMLFESSAPHCVSPQAIKGSLEESLKAGFGDWCASLRCSLHHP